MLVAVDTSRCMLACLVDGSECG